MTAQKQSKKSKIKVCCGPACPLRVTLGRRLVLLAAWLQP